MNADLVSVIIPAFNAERFIEATLASVRGQTYPYIEIIVVDDGSTDRTVELVEHMAAEDTRIRLVRQANAGVSAARNAAINNATGNLIAPIDADDVWLPQKLAKQIERMRSAGANVGVVYCWSVGIDEGGAISVPSWSRNRFVGDVRDELAVGNILGNGSCPLIRASCLHATGGYDPDLKSAEDWKLYLALAEICEFDVVPEYLVAYRVGSGGSADLERMDQSVRRVTDWLIERRQTIPGSLLRRQMFRTNSYLSFLALTQGKVSTALKYRWRAYRARPAELLGMNVLLFARDLLGKVTFRLSVPQRRPPLFKYVNGALVWSTEIEGVNR